MCCAYPHSVPDLTNFCSNAWPRTDSNGDFLHYIRSLDMGFDSRYGTVLQLLYSWSRDLTWPAGTSYNLCLYVFIYIYICSHLCLTSCAVPIECIVCTYLSDISFILPLYLKKTASFCVFINILETIEI